MPGVPPGSSPNVQQNRQKKPRRWSTHLPNRLATGCNWWELQATSFATYRTRLFPLAISCTRLLPLRVNRPWDLKISDAINHIDQVTQQNAAMWKRRQPRP